ncbi:hypothetical protein [Reyranella sp.]|uniref:hypothetical protein n=1 Tax=Reyranella sp. TaxID=1929291 RepID=UPI003BA8C25A
MLAGTKAAPHTLRSAPRRRFLSFGIAVAGAALLPAAAHAQTIDVRHWNGVAALTRQPEQVVAGTMAEWRSLWGRVGAPAPDLFEPGRMNAVGIFLGRRSSEGYSVNVLSASRRRDRIVVVFEERMPPEIMMAQRASPPPPRPVASSPGGGFGGPAAGFAAPGATANLAPTAPTRPIGHPTSPWAIILINRADLPVTVEQRLFR